MTFALRRFCLVCWVPLIALGLSAGISRVDAQDMAKFHWADRLEAGQTDLLLGDKPVLRYMAMPYDTSGKEKTDLTYKVFHHVFAPDGKTLITKGAGGTFPHHRGLYVAWNKTSYEGKTDDFWHCTKGARQQHVKFISQTGDEKHGAATSEIHWNDADGKPVIIETRSIDVSRSSEGTTGWQINWRTSLASQRGEIKLDGDRQHAGFQFRAPQVIADKNSARFMRPDGFPQQPEAVQVGDAGDPPAHSNIPWVAMTYEVDGQRFTVAYFEDPSVPKPSLFSERPYGRFGAFWKTTLTPEKPLQLRYRLVITTGESPSRDTIQKWFDAFVEEIKVAK